MLWSTKIIMGALYVDITSQLFEKSMLIRYYQLKGLTKNLDGLLILSHVCLASLEWTEWGCVCDCSRSASWAVSPGCLGIWGADSTHSACTDSQTSSDSFLVSICFPASQLVSCLPDLQLFTSGRHLCEEALMLASASSDSEFCCAVLLPARLAHRPSAGRDRDRWELGRWEERCSHFLLC